MERDAYSGNGISLAIIDKNGVRVYPDEEIQEMIDKIKKNKRKQK